MYAEILTEQPAPGVFVSPKTAEGNCKGGFASTGSPVTVTGDPEETPVSEVFSDSTI